MTGKYFISYSRLDQQIAARLHHELENSSPPFPVFMDIYDIKPGQDYDEVLTSAARGCLAVLFLMSADSIAKGTQCKNEWGMALRCRRPVIPIKLEQDVEPPMDFVRSQWVDFSADFESGLKMLKEHLTWMRTPAGELDHQRTLLALAERDWRRASTDHSRMRAQSEIDRLQEIIARLEEVLSDGDAAEQRVAYTIARAIERERQEVVIASTGRTHFINPPPGIAPNHFQDRIDETKFVSHFLRDETQRIITVVGRGGVGKTALICRLLKGLESGQFPDGLGPFQCDGIVYLSGAGSHKISAPNIFQDLVKLLPAPKAAELRGLYEKADVSLHDKTLALLDAFPNGCTVLLLDNFEDAIEPETRRLTDDSLRELLTTVLTSPHHSVKVILTTRVAPVDFSMVQPGRQSLREIGSGLPSPYAENILREMDHDGSLGLRDAPAELLGTLRELTGGYPKALEALVGLLSNDRAATIEEVLEHAGGCLPEKVVEAFVGEAYSRLDPQAQQVMQALAIYGRPVTANAIDFLLQPWSPVVNSARVLNRLANMFFVRKEAGRYFLHPMDTEHALSLLPSTLSAQTSGAVSFDARTLRMRGADYFKQIRKAAEQWKSLDDLLPQLAEFDLRFAAGEFEEAWYIISSIGFHYLRAWGHYRMHADLLTKLVVPLTGTPLEASVVGELGICHRNLGEAREAVTCFETSLKLVRSPKHRLPDLGSEAVWLSNLGATLDILGETQRSIACHERALEIDRQRGDTDGIGIDFHNLAGRLAELGQTDRAVRLCQDSIDIARRLRPHNTHGYLFKEGLRLATLARLLLDAGRPTEAINTAKEALSVSASLHSPEINCRAWMFLGLGLLQMDQILPAVEALDTSASFDFPRYNDTALTSQGLGRLAANDSTAARDCFETVIRNTSRKLEHCADHYRALDDQAMARAGLIVCGDATLIDSCIVLLRRLAQLSPNAVGFANRRRRWLKIAAVQDKHGLLKTVLAEAELTG